MNCSFCHSPNACSATTCAACGAPLSSGALPGANEPLLAPGTRLHNTFRIEGVLGQGGFGVTYRAHDLGLDRPVAIKEFFPSGCRRRNGMVQPPGEEHQENSGDAIDFERARRRFLEEARRQARFAHPGIANVYTCFAENNTAYMVMELLQGQTLAARLQKGGRLEEGEALSIISRIGEALQEMHSAGLLHRDIKPENVMLCHSGRVVLIDFGTAHDAGLGATGEAGAIMVTPGYAPLEQYATGTARGAFSDVYALAATLYHLLCGQMPPPASDRAAGVAIVPPHRVNPSVSSRVEFAVLRGLETEVSKRPQTVAEFLKLLKPTLPGSFSPGTQTTSIQPPGGVALQNTVPASLTPAQLARLPVPAVRYLTPQQYQNWVTSQVPSRPPIPAPPPPANDLSKALRDVLWVGVCLFALLGFIVFLVFIFG